MMPDSVDALRCCDSYSPIMQIIRMISGNEIETEVIGSPYAKFELPM